ncbi:hypothetical protein CRG98_008780 [Punica granatum]|uniref:Uncharacterized protein n=1 Tax=Punica granatum TaxID=22663 RepID=A0A2I0KQZ1_PUNGR|nr:hypothetical protein CRG98_008780 [Punica granatum]
MGCRTWRTLNSGNPVMATPEWLDCDWGPHRCTFPDCRWACPTVLGEAQGAESHSNNGWLVATAEGGLGPFFDRQCDRAGSPVLGAGLGELPLRLWLADEFLILWRVGEVLVGWRTLLRHQQEAERGVSYQD